jgi:NAD-dependent SIR2 family protein deacetylase
MRYGAGVSRPLGIPTMKEFSDIVFEKLSEMEESRTVLVLSVLKCGERNEQKNEFWVLEKSRFYIKKPTTNARLVEKK